MWTIWAARIFEIMVSIDEATAWSIIRESRRTAPATEWSQTGAVAIAPDGQWSTSDAVSPAAAMLFDTLLPVACSKPNYVIAQIGQSLDGRIATWNGHSHYVTSPASRVHLHRLRALVDAVVVGASTATIDNPRLTVRHVAGDNPIRVVLDPNGRVPHDRAVFADGGAPAWHAVCSAASAAPGTIPVLLSDTEPGDVIRQLVHVLSARGLRRILVEGGGVTISHFLETGCVDRLHVVVAPILLGSGRPALALPQIDTLDAALRPACRQYALGPDRLYDLDLHQSAQSTPRGAL